MSRDRTAIHWRERSGFSLVITLALVALMAVLLVSYLTRSEMELQATQSYSNSIEAGALARGAIEEVLAGLGEEVVAAVDPVELIPARTLARIGSDSADPRESNLVRLSTGNAGDFIAGYAAAGQSPPDLLAADSATDARSINGRYFPSARWDAPRLRADGAPAVVPDWIYVTRGESRRVTDSEIADLSDADDLDNADAVVGRYAYVLYDIGGLLDVNLAGALSTDADVRRTQKGPAATVELGGLIAASGGADADALINWRDPNGLLAAAFGVDPEPGDPGQPGSVETGRDAVTPDGSRLVSRQDLLGFMERYEGGNALPRELADRLTTYSFAVNGPEIPEVIDETNRVTAETPIPRYDVESGALNSYVIAAGEPVFARKFPLSRLRWFEQRKADGSPEDSVRAAIKQHLGLTWVEDLAAAGIAAPEFAGVPGFVYTSPEGTVPVVAIRTLDEVAALPNKREPDFFEWLKAAIAPGSLGATGGASNSILPGLPGNTQEESRDFHVIQIGANIMDQADSDDVPTLIASASAPDRNGDPLVAFGVESHPYLNELIGAVVRTTEPGGQMLQSYLQPELWALHANAGDERQDHAGNPVTQYRMRVVEGTAILDASLVLRNSAGGAFTYLSDESKRRRTIVPKTFSGGVDDMLTFTVDSDDFVEPALVNGEASSNTFQWGLGRNLRPGPAPWEDNFAGVPAAGAMVPERVFASGEQIPLSQLSLTDAERDALEDPSLPGFTYPIGKKLHNQAGLSFDPYFRPLNTPAGVEPAPATVVMEVNANGRWIPYQIWESLQRFAGLQEDPRFRGVANEEMGSFPFEYVRVLTRSGPGPEGLSWCRPVLAGDPDPDPVTPHPNEPDPYPSANGLDARFFWGWNVRNARVSMMKSDPRTRRFGTATGIGGSPGVSIRDTAAAWDASTAGMTSRTTNWDSPEFATTGGVRVLTNLEAIYPAVMPGWQFARTIVNNGRLIAALADLGRNSEELGSATWYADPDGVNRPADFEMVPDVNFPTIPGQVRARPVILNRPFRSVAELGYVFRDIPFRSIDMIRGVGADEANPLNPDLGLLNVFSIADAEVIAGRIDPAAARAEVVAAVLRGGGKSPVDPTLGEISGGEANAVAEALDDLGAAVTSGSGTLGDVVGLLNSTGAVSPKVAGANIKGEAEAYGRALAALGNRRSWTLMLDVVAQAGRFPANATQLSDFNVTGERRYWVSFTLDRYTGKTSNLEIEPVYE